MSAYRRQLVRVTVGMLCSWRALPWALGQVLSAVGEVGWALYALALALVSPFLVLLAPAIAWAAAERERRADDRREALRAGIHRNGPIE